MKKLERGLGGLLVLLAVGVATTARTFDVGFLVDPLGPKALPYLVAALFLVGGVALRHFPSGGEPGAEDGGAWAAQGLCVLLLLGYAGALSILGFVPSTALATGALARVFSGRFLKGLVVGLALGLGLFGLFSLGFGLELPVGLLFGGEW